MFEAQLMVGHCLMMDGAKPPATGANSCEMRPWGDTDWLATRERTETRHRIHKAQQ